MKTFLLAAVMILPGALFVANLAGTFWYNRDHAIAERTHRHLSDARYFAVLNEYEIVGGIVGGLPGLLLLVTPKVLAARERRKASASRAS